MDQNKTIQVKQAGEVFNIEPIKGKSILATAFVQDVPLDYKCQKGNCTRCKVELMSGQEMVNKPTPKEHEKLEGELNEGYRLACQTVPLK